MHRINRTDRDALYEHLLQVAKKKTAQADVKLDSRGRPVDEEELSLGDNVWIVDPAERAAQLAAQAAAGEQTDEP